MRKGGTGDNERAANAQIFDEVDRIRNARRLAVSRAHTDQPQAVERPLQCVLTDRLIDNVYPFSVRNLTGDSYEVFGRVIDNVITTEVSSDLGLRVGTNGTDYSCSEMACPRTKDMAHAASGRMDQNVISRLHLVRSMQEVLRSHALEDYSCQLNVIQWQVLWNLDQLVSRVKALLAVGAEWGKEGANSFADGESGDARTQLLDLANSFETEDNRRIANDHRVRDTCSMVRISEIHADGRAAKTYLATLGRSDLDLLPHEVVGRAFLVDYRRHSHDAFLLLLGAFLLRGSQLSRANSSA